MPKGINVGAGAQKASLGPGSCGERVGCRVDGTSRSEEGGGRAGEFLPRVQGPIHPGKAGQEVVLKVKLVGGHTSSFPGVSGSCKPRVWHATSLVSLKVVGNGWGSLSPFGEAREAHLALAPVVPVVAAQVHALGLEGALQGAKGDSQSKAQR